jgi:hypothetical protein
VGELQAVSRRPEDAPADQFLHTFRGVDLVEVGRAGEEAEVAGPAGHRGDGRQAPGELAEKAEPAADHRAKSLWRRLGKQRRRPGLSAEGPDRLED